jgi:hypothetical protein
MRRASLELRKNEEVATLHDDQSDTAASALSTISSPRVRAAIRHSRWRHESRSRCDLWEA